MLRAKLIALFEKYETRLEIAFFVGGFIFDIWMLAAPDELFSILQQVAYLILIGAMIHYELLFRVQRWRPGPRLMKLWTYRTLVLHFLLGSLLSVYSLFYIKSASVFGSIIFLLFMVGLLLANEFPLIKRSNVSLKVGLFAICLFSFLSVIYPLIFGFIGIVPFLFSVATTLGIFYLQVRSLKTIVTDTVVLYRALLAPAASVMAIFTVFYFLGWIPPVPLSVRDHGVYHAVEKRDGKYILSYEKKWSYWFQNGDSEFRAEPGDKIFYFVQIYSPARISDQVSTVWYLKDSRNRWVKQDQIPLRIQGGRQEGYRGQIYKSNYSPGKWKIEVRTSNDIEISRLYFEVVGVPKTEGRVFDVIEK